jgi:GntR family transcriptional repressor for pyruvate dehydrogenase complex
MQESIVDQAAEAIREYVISRELAAGQRLPSERELAEALGTSRGALREAIRRLSAERVVEVRGRSGIYIASPDVAQIFAVRLQLEPLAAYLAATERSPAELRELHGTLAELRRDVASPAAFAAADRRLHGAIARSSGNVVLADFVSQLSDLTLISRGVTARSDEIRRGTLADMVKIVRAIRSREGKAASEAMVVHLHRIQVAAVGKDIESPRLPHLPRRLEAR